MKKINKRGNKGFTLVEMVLVIAIIVILAGVLIMGVGDFIDRARNAASSMAEHNRNLSLASAAVDGQVGW